MELPAFLRPSTELPPGDASPLRISAAAGAPPNPLSFGMQTQQQSEWCWAAVAASIAAFYGDTPAKSQCELATHYLGLPCCIDPLPAAPPPRWAGNRSFTLDVPLQVLKHLAAPVIPDVMSFEDIVKDIDAGKPICCHIRWATAAPHDGHFNVIVGYVRELRELVIHDPYATYGHSTLPYDTFKSNYHGGSWDQTCRTT